jgi:hypothetical protein
MSAKSERLAGTLICLPRDPRADPRESTRQIVT